MENIKYIYADGTLGGTFSKEMIKKYNIVVEISKIPIAQKGKVKIHEKVGLSREQLLRHLIIDVVLKIMKEKTEHANAYLTIANRRRLAKKY